MDCGDHKLYHVHGFDSRKVLDTFVSHKKVQTFEEDTMKFPLKKLHHIFEQGHITGYSLTDISVGPYIHHLYPAMDFFKEITLLRASERCITELNKWHNTRTGAFDFTHAAEILADVSGKGDQCLDNDEKLKATIKQILKCDPQQENLIDPEILPKADCVITSGFLEFTSQNLKEYERNLKKISDLLKPGGHLIVTGMQNATYLMVGEEKIHVLKYDEADLQKALTDEGFTIDHCEVHSRKAESDLANYQGIIFLSAHKSQGQKPLGGYKKNPVSYGFYHFDDFDPSRPHSTYFSPVFDKTIFEINVPRLVTSGKSGQKKRRL